MKTKATTMKLISLGTKILFNQKGNFMGAEGGGGEPEGGSEGGGEPSGDGPSWQYPEGFDETLKDNPTLMKYADKEKGTFDYAKIMKAHVHATGMLGKDKTPLPDETWTDDQWSELYHKLGKPEALDNYEVKGELPEGMEENKEFASKFKEMAFGANLLPKQANKLYSEINQYIHESLENADQMSKQEYDSQVNKLRQEWGEAFDKRCQKAYSALEQFATDEEIQALKNEGFISSPIVTRLFNKIAEGLEGDNFNLGGETKTFGLTPQEAQEEIAKMYQPGHPFMTKGHPQRDYYVQKMQKLQRIKLAGRGK